MLNPLQRGFTLIELIIGLVIVGILLAMGAPSFSDWIRNTQIRTVSEAVQNGLQLARAEAVRRNTVIGFQLVTTLDPSCALSTAGPYWVVSLTVAPSSLPNAAGKCHYPPSTPPDDPAAAVATDPYIVQKYDGGNSARSVVIAASQSQITFNGLGRVTNGPAGAVNMTIDITNPVGGDCKAASGPMRCLRLSVSPSGQIRMCDPSMSATDPQGCPS